jgi:type VI protein secretion system component VasK
MQMRRSGILIALTAIVGMFLSLLVTAFTWDWHVSWQKAAIQGGPTLVIAIFLLWAMRRGATEIQDIDAQDKKNRNTEADERDRKLIKAINEAANERDLKLVGVLTALNQTLQTLQEQNRAIIAALGQLEPKGRDEE